MTDFLTAFNHNPLIPVTLLLKLFPAAGSRMTIHRLLKRHEFPPPADTRNGTRYWRLADIVAWDQGKRDWPGVDDPAAAQRAAIAARARAGKLLKVQAAAMRASAA